MPIYEYQCTDCSFQFELKRGFSENSPVTCPKCGGDTRRIFSPVPIIFKGSGFYCTDNAGCSSGLGCEPDMNEASPDKESPKPGE